MNNILIKNRALQTLLLLVAGTCVSVQAGEISSLPAAPGDLNAEVVSAEEVNLSWLDKSTDEQGFSVQRSEDGMLWDTIGELGANAADFQDLSAEPGTRYSYRVLSLAADGNSSASNLDTVLTPPLLDFELDSRYFQTGSVFGQF